MRQRITLPLAVVALVAAPAGCGAGSHHKRSTSSVAPAQRVLPGGIVGVMFDGPVTADGVDLGRQLDLAVASGVESLRVSVDWSAAQPYRSFAQVPAGQRDQFTDVGGVPTRFAPLDRIVGAAAARGLTVLPVVEHAPGWDAQHPGSPASNPSSPAPYAAFLTALVKRYGTRGA